MEKYDENGNRIYYRNLKKENIIEYVASRYGYDDFIEYEGWILNKKTGEIVARLEYENGLYNLLSKDATTYNKVI